MTVLTDLDTIAATGKNPKGSVWRSTPQAKRHRKALQLTVSPEAIERLALLAPPGRRSEFVEALIMAAPLPEDTRRP